MSRINNPYDNATAESFMETHKQEEVDGRDYRNVAAARGSISHFYKESTTGNASIPPSAVDARRVQSRLAARENKEFFGA